MNKKLQDHVWKHCLPKEFKEEVKNQFRDGFNEDRKAIGRLFGVDNLLSDAEGEEMLTCKKDQAVKLYDIADRAYAVSSDKWYQGYMKAMIDLFGSKCLPDEAKDGAKDEAKEPKSVEQSNEESATLHAESVEESRIASEESHLRNFSQSMSNCNKSDEGFPHDARKVGTVYQRTRLNIAAMVVASIMGSDDWTPFRGGTDEKVWHNMAKASLGVADALIAESVKKGGKYEK